MKTPPHLTLGLVGEPLTGKDTLAAYLVEQYGFVHVSTGDFVRFYILENNLGEPTRPLLKHVANKLRTEHGPDYFAQLALRNEATHLVISGLRNPHEVAAIRSAGGTILALTAPLEVRYARAQERGRATDNLSFEEFKRQQTAEDTSSNPNAQNMAEVLAMADISLSNTAGRIALHQHIDDMLVNLLQ